MAIYYIGWCIPRFRTKKYNTEILGTPKPCILYIYTTCWYLNERTSWVPANGYSCAAMYHCQDLGWFWGPPWSIFRNPMVSPWPPWPFVWALSRAQRARLRAPIACQGLVKIFPYRVSIIYVYFHIYQYFQKKKVSIKSLRKRCFSYFFRSFTINIRKISCFPLFSHRFHTFRPIGATAATGSSSASSPIASAGIEVVYHPWYPRIYIYIYIHIYIYIYVI